MPLRTPAAPNALSAFMREVGRIDMLDAAGEQHLARTIEERERALWQCLLSFAPAHALVRDTMAAAAGENAPDLRALRRAASAVLAGKGRDSTLTRAAARAAEALRAADRDHDLLDAILDALERVARGRDELPPGMERGAFDAWMAEIRLLAAQAAQARNAFIEANLRLVFMVANQYATFGVPLSDLVQEGSLGLMTAVNRFDPDRGLRFSTYAVWWIRHAVRRAVANKSRMVRVPVYLLESKQRLDRVRRELSTQLGRPPTDEELAAAADVSRTRIDTVRTLSSGFELSLDQSDGEDRDQPRLDTFRDPHDEARTPVQELALRDQVAHLSSVFDILSAQEADILRKRFALEDEHEWTLREIAQCYGVSRERIRQLQNRALGKLRKAMDDLDTPAAA